MNAETRQRLAAAMAPIADGMAQLQDLAADDAADLLPSERRHLLTESLSVDAALARLTGMADRASRRAPRRTSTRTGA